MIAAGEPSDRHARPVATQRTRHHRRRPGPERALLLAQRVVPLLARHWRVHELPAALHAAEPRCAAAERTRRAGTRSRPRRGGALWRRVEDAAEPIIRARDAAQGLGERGLQAECGLARLHRRHLQQEPDARSATCTPVVRLGAAHRPLRRAALYVIATLYQEA